MYAGTRDLKRPCTPAENEGSQLLHYSAKHGWLVGYSLTRLVLGEESKVKGKLLFLIRICKQGQALGQILF